MSNVLFTSDLHEGHKNIGKFRRIPQEFLEDASDATEANSDWLDYWWNLCVRRRDTVYCLGDNAFNMRGLLKLDRRHGRLKMYGGNHDDLPAEIYLAVFETLRGCESKYGAWLSHFPLHPTELRGKFCVHGHTHYKEIDDYRYINVCCDNLYEKIGKPFLTLEELRVVMAKRKLSKKVEWL